MRRPSTPTTAPLTPTAATGTPADPNEGLDGLRARLAQLDRRLGVRTYALGAAVVLALAAGAVGVVLALSVQRDAATQDDIAALRDEVAAARVSATQAAQKDVQSISDRLDQLDGEVTRLTSDRRTSEREIQVIQGDIRDLQDQVSSLETSGTGTGTTSTGAGGAPTGSGAGSGSGGGGGGTFGTP
jgi:uncharacterized protein HemX